MGSRWLFAVGFGCLACGGAPAAKAPEAPASTESAALPDRLRETAALATVASVPADRVWLHVEAPGRDLPVLGTFDLGREDLLAVLQNPQLAARLIMGEGPAGAIDLNRPVDVLVDPTRPARGVSMSFGVGDPAKLEKLELLRLSAGRWEIQRARSGMERYCEVWHAAAGFRLICAHAKESIEQDAAFHLHGAHAGGDRPSLRIEAPGKLFQALLAKKMAERPATESNASERGEEFGRALMMGFFEEQTTLAFEIRLEPKSVDMVLELGFGSTKNPLSLWWTGGAESRVSDAFWRVPKSASLAFYKGAADPAALSAAAQPMFDVIEKVATEEEPRPGFAAQAMAALRELLPPGGAGTLAHGRSPEGDPKSRGWMLLGLDLEPSKYLADLKKFIALANVEAKKSQSKQKPTVSRLRIVPGTPGLPAGSLHVLEDSVKNPRYRPAKGEKPVPLPAATHVFVVAEGPRTWLSFSSDPAQALAGARGVLTSTREQSLASVSELAEPSKRPLAGIGKLDVAGIAALTADDGQVQAVERRLAVLPYAGKSPIPIWIEVAGRKAGDGRNETVSRLVGRLPPEAMADLARLLIDRPAQGTK